MSRTTRRTTETELKRRVRRVVRLACKFLGVKPVKVVFLSRIPRDVERDLRAMGLLREARRYGGMYYDAGRNAIYVLPNTTIDLFSLMHEVAHYYQHVRRGLPFARVRSRVRERIEREADRLAGKLVRFLEGRM